MMHMKTLTSVSSQALGNDLLVAQSTLSSNSLANSAPPLNPMIQAALSALLLLLLNNRP